MKFDDLRAEVDADLSIDPSELGAESIRTPMIHSKYLNHFYDVRLIIRKLRSELSVLRKDKWLWITGKMSEEELRERGWEACPLRVLRQDMEMHLAADPEIRELEAKIAIQEERIAYLESVLRQINSRQWLIRNAIDFLKFKNGIS
jgi:hypothetical protein